MARRKMVDDTWEKVGYQNSALYDASRNVLKYGDYEFHGDQVGVKRQTFQIDPTNVRSIQDIYRQLGADDRMLQRLNRPIRFSTTMQNTGVFSGADAWKNDTAKQLWEQINPSAKGDRIASSLYGSFRTNNPTTPSWAVRAPVMPNIATQRLDSGVFQVTATDQIPNSYSFVNRLSSMANALSATIAGGDGSSQRPRRRSATGAF